MLRLEAPTSKKPSVDFCLSDRHMLCILYSGQKLEIAFIRSITFIHLLKMNNNRSPVNIDKSRK